jgi:anti-sigma B factor antagonist
MIPWKRRRRILRRPADEKWAGREMNEIRTEVIYSGETAIVKLTGYIDSENFAEARDNIEKIIKSGKTRIVADLSGITYMSSAGWGVFVGNVKSAREAGGDIKLAAMQEEVENVYKLVEFNEILASYKTVEEAKNSF